MFPLAGSIFFTDLGIFLSHFSSCRGTIMSGYRNMKSQNQLSVVNFPVTCYMSGLGAVFLKCQTVRIISSQIQGILLYIFSLV